MFREDHRTPKQEIKCTFLVDDLEFNVLLWDAPPLSNGQHQKYYDFLKGMPINLHLPRPLGGGAYISSNIFKTCDGWDYHNISRKVRSLLEVIPKRRFWFFNSGGFKLFKLFAIPPIIELMLPQIFQVGSQKTPPGLRFPIMMQVLCYDELSWFQGGFFTLC